MRLGRDIFLACETAAREIHAIYASRLATRVRSSHLPSQITIVLQSKATVKNDNQNQAKQAVEVNFDVIFEQFGYFYSVTCL